MLQKEQQRSLRNAQAKTGGSTSTCCVMVLAVCGCVLVLAAPRIHFGNGNELQRGRVGTSVDALEQALRALTVVVNEGLGCPEWADPLELVTALPAGASNAAGLGAW